MAEKQNIEWKESWRDEYLKWICGFANAQGGKIYIGVNDDGKVVGIENSKKLLEDIPNKIQNKLGIIADVNLLQKDELEYIEIVVSPWSFPVNYNGEYHYRSGSTKQQLRGDALTMFLASKIGAKWDAATVSNIGVADLDKESFDIFRREALRSGRMTEEDLNVPDQELLERLGLMTDGKLKRAGALCFYRYPEKVINGCYVKIGKFNGPEIVYQDEVHGSLLIMADRIIDLIYLKYLKAAVTYHKETRVETYPYARNALREAVFNSLIHCNWAANVPIQIRVNEDTLSIANCSCLPTGWTAETIMGKHTSVPYNPDIAGVFYRAGYVESWGRGIEKICRACTELGADLPEYRVTGADTMVIFNALQSSKVPKFQSSTMKETLENEVLRILREDPATSQTMIAERVGVSVSSVKRITAALAETGRITRVGGKRYGHWVICE